MNSLISIIVPIYNAEKYLAQCIESVLIQTYTNFELILVDDGSKDNSFVICMDYLKKDNRVKVFHKQNSGVSETRNLGIKKSKGDYIMFLDSDDYWFSDKVLESLVKRAIDNNLDLIRGNYVRVSENGNVLNDSARAQNITGDKECYDSFEMLKYVVKGEYFLWLFFIKSDIVKKYSFDKSLVFCEDMCFLIQMFCDDLRCGYMPAQFYAYRQVQTSASKKVNVKNVISSFSLCNKFYECAGITSISKLSEFYLYYSIMMYYWTLETLASKEYINKYKEIDDAVNLKKLQYEVKITAKKMRSRSFPLQVFVTPKTGIRLFRLRWKIGSILRTLHLK